MNVAISAVRTKNTRINRYELVSSIQKLGHKVMYIGQESNDQIHSDYSRFNVEFLSIPLERSEVNPLREIKAVIKTWKVLKENKVEVLLVYGIRTFPTMVLAAKLAKVKQILCIVNGSGRLFQLSGVKGYLVKAISYPMLTLAFTLSNHILFQNKDDLKMISNKKLLHRRNYSTINGSGVNLEKYNRVYLQQAPIFTMISRITGSKGVNEYIQAAKLVKKLYPNTIFNLIGPMDNEDFSINMNELNDALENRIISYTPEVEDVRPYINGCRVFVLPSYYPEGIPRSIIEAMAMGRPIITTNTPGCKETVEDGANGFKIPPKDVQELVEKMKWMIENPKKVEDMGIRSRKICEDKFNVNDINQKMLKIIGLR